MAFLKRAKVERKKSDKVTAAAQNRKQVPMSLIVTKLGDDVKMSFSISKQMFDRFGLDKRSMLINDNPLCLVFTKENSQLSQFFQSKREGTANKARQFASPELITALQKAALIPDELPVGTKVNFNLTDATELVVEANKVEADELAADIEAVASVEVTEVTTFEPRKRKETGEAEDSEVAEVEAATTEGTVQETEEAEVPVENVVKAPVADPFA